MYINKENEECNLQVLDEISLSYFMVLFKNWCEELLKFLKGLVNRVVSSSVDFWTRKCALKNNE